MKVSNQGKDFIKHWEGYKEEVYRDLGGLSTIGYGHLLTPAEALVIQPIKRAVFRITREQAEAFFEEDIKEVEDAINSMVKVPLTQNQFDSVASLVFNWGTGNFKRSECLEALNKKDFAQAIVELKEVNKVRKGNTWQVSQGLTNRREAESIMFAQAPTMATIA